MDNYISIRKLAHTGIMSERELRRRLRAGRLPGIYTGDKQQYFRVNVPALIEMLEAESRQAVNG